MVAKLFWRSTSFLVLILTPQIAIAEMIIHTKDGQQHNVPVNGNEVERIEFNDLAVSNWQGFWDTSEGTMNLSQTGDRVSGNYNQDNGRIEGTVTNNVLDGYWIESGSARKCSTSKSNSSYWGRISWQQDASKKTFTGKWGYCNDEPSSGWTGKR